MNRLTVRTLSRATSCYRLLAFTSFICVLKTIIAFLKMDLGLGLVGTLDETLEAKEDFLDKTTWNVEKMQHLAKVQKVYNEDVFGPVTKETVVIAVQVHDRIHYLEALIESMSQVSGIESALLIFSHDVWDPEINELIAKIDFAMYTQIFYPYSNQLHRGQFPDDSAQDCPRDISREEATRLKCLNAKYPDKFGHYREARVTQMKHHWWWKANRIFHQLRVTKDVTRLVLFLEEDLYLTKDALHTLRLLDSKRLDQDDLIVMGSRHYGPQVSRQAFTAEQRRLANFVPWHRFHVDGWVFTRSLWTKVRGCGHFFCSHDDYDYNLTLNHLNLKCLADGIRALVVRSPRVIHTGKCGMYNFDVNASRCDAKEVVKSIDQVLSGASVFAEEMVVKRESEARADLFTAGGFGDIRDRALCILMSSDLHGSSSDPSMEELILARNMIKMEF